MLKILIDYDKSEFFVHKDGHVSQVILQFIMLLIRSICYECVKQLICTYVMIFRKTYMCSTLLNNYKGNLKGVMSKNWKFIWQRNKYVVLCKWKDTCDVHEIAKMHKVEMLETETEKW